MTILQLIDANLFKILLLSSINSSFGGASSAYVVPLLGLFFTGEFLFQNSSILSWFYYLSSLNLAIFHSYSDFSSLHLFSFSIWTFSSNSSYCHFIFLSISMRIRLTPLGFCNSTIISFAIFGLNVYSDNIHCHYFLIITFSRTIFFSHITLSESYCLRYIISEYFWSKYFSLKVWGAKKFNAVFSTSYSLN